MKVILNLLIAILALGVIAKPLPDDHTELIERDSEAEETDAPSFDDVEVTADSVDDSTDDTGLEARAIIDGLLSPRSLIAGWSSEPASHSAQPQGTFSVLKQQMTQLSTASSSLGKSVSTFASNPSFTNIYALTVQFNTFITTVTSSAGALKGLKPVTSASDANNAVALVRPFMASLNTMTQGLVQKKDVLVSLGIGCIFQELLALLLILICLLFELLLFLCQINVACVKQLTQYQNEVKVGMKAAIAAFATQSNKSLL